MDHTNYLFQNVRAAAILTNAYVAGTVIGPFTGVGATPAHMNQLVLLADFTIGSTTDCMIKVEGGHLATDLYQESIAGAPSAGVSTVAANVYKLTATGKYRLFVPIKDNFIKISAIATGTVTSSSLKLDAVVGTV